MNKYAFKDHFSTDSAAYARHRPVYPEALYDWLAEQAPGRVCAWDCATGSGQAALGLTRHFQRVIATDAAAAQINHAQPHPRIEYRAAPAEQPGLAASSIDLVTVAQALHWFEHGAFFRAVAEVLRENGILAVWSYHLLRIDASVDALLDEFYRHTVGTYWPAERVLLEDAYRGIDFPFQEIPAPSFKMNTFWELADVLGYLGTWSAVKRYREARGEDPLQHLQDPLREAWGNPEEKRCVTWPLHLKVGKHA